MINWGAVAAIDTFVKIPDITDMYILPKCLKMDENNYWKW